MFFYNPAFFGVAAFVNTKSLSFDGVDEYLNLSRVTMQESATYFSLSMWVKTSSLAIFQNISGTNEGSLYGRNYTSIQTDGSVQWVLATQNLYPLVRTSASDITIGTWHHICFVFDGSLSGNFNRAKIYIDGVSSAVTDSSTIPSTTGSTTFDFKIGTRSDNVSPFNGNIDEVSLFDYALTSGEVTSIYNSGCPNNLMTLSDPKKPEHYYRMGDNDTYPTITDI